MSEQTASPGVNSRGYQGISATVVARLAGWLAAAASLMSLAATTSALAVTWMFPVSKTVQAGDRLAFDRSRALPETVVTPWWAPDGYPYGLNRVGIAMLMCGLVGLVVAPLLVTRLANTTVARLSGPAVAGTLLLTAVTTIVLVVKFRCFWIEKIGGGGGFRLGSAFWMIAGTAALATAALCLYAFAETIRARHLRLESA